MTNTAVQEPGITPEDRRHAQVLWEYHNIESTLPASADFILALGSHDTRVAVRAAELALEGKAPVLVTSGGAGKVTGALWARPEAERFAEIAQSMGVAPNRILVESDATNTGENVTLTRELLESKGMPTRAGILVTKPYMKRRALATAKKQWTSVEWFVDGPQIEFADYPTAETPERRMIELMVGDLQRIDIYPSRGLQVHMAIPNEVRAAYQSLVAAGFDRFVIA